MLRGLGPCRLLLTTDDQTDEPTKRNETLSSICVAGARPALGPETPDAKPDLAFRKAVPLSHLSTNQYRAKLLVCMRLFVSVSRYLTGETGGQNGASLRGIDQEIYLYDTKRRQTKENDTCH